MVSGHTWTGEHAEAERWGGAPYVRSAPCGWDGHPGGAGKTVYQRAATFDLKRHGGYFAADVIRKLLLEKEEADRKQHRGNPHTRTPTDRTGDEVPGRKNLPGPHVAASERRIAGTSAPNNAHGKKI